MFVLAVQPTVRTMAAEAITPTIAQFHLERSSWRKSIFGLGWSLGRDNVVPLGLSHETVEGGFGCPGDASQGLDPGKIPTIPRDNLGEGSCHTRCPIIEADKVCIGVLCAAHRYVLLPLIVDVGAGLLWNTPEDTFPNTRKAVASWSAMQEAVKEASPACPAGIR